LRALRSAADADAADGRLSGARADAVRRRRCAARLAAPRRRLHLSVQHDGASRGDGARRPGRGPSGGPPARRRARPRGPAPPGGARLRAGAAVRRVAARAPRHRLMDATTLPALLDAVTTRFAAREALVSARRRLTYAALAAEAERVERALAA